MPTKPCYTKSPRPWGRYKKGPTKTNKDRRRRGGRKDRRTRKKSRC